MIHVDERDGEADVGGEDGSAPAGQTGEVLEAFGTLSISEHGISRFFGPTGGSEVRLALYAMRFRFLIRFDCAVSFDSTSFRHSP